MAKTLEMETLLNNFTQKLFGRSRDGSVCVTCGLETVSDKVKKNRKK